MNKTIYYSHPDFLQHQTGPGHPECAGRLTAIETALKAPEFSNLIRLEAPLGSIEQIQLIHRNTHIEHIFAAIPHVGEHFLDWDTILTPGTKNAALRAVGAVCEAVDKIMSNQANNAFCAVRPPGHHSEPDQSMGFCIFNNIAIAAEYARHHYHLKRIAIVDFDVHHGNGTQAAFFDQPEVLYASSHEMPHYPGTGHPSEIGVGNIVNVALSHHESSEGFRQKYMDVILPALHHFKPELLLISAGFDGHKDDPLSSTLLTEDDFGWLTRELMTIADQYCRGRIISALEGGYNLPALASSVAVHIRSLLHH